MSDERAGIEQGYTIDRICFIRWSERPTGEEARTLAEAIVAARRRVGRRLILVGIMARGGLMPDAQGRKESHRLLPAIEHSCEHMYCVLPGDTFLNALVRGTMAAISAAMRSPGTIVSTVREAITLACLRLGLDPAAVLAEARARGFGDD